MNLSISGKAIPVLSLSFAFIAGYCSMRYGIVFIVLFVSILLSLVILARPIIGLMMMAFLIPLEALTIFNASVTTFKVLGVWVFFCWFAQYTISSKKTIKTGKFFWLFLIFSGWGLVSLLWATDSEVLFIRFFGLLRIAGLYFLIINLVDSEKKLNWVISSFVTGCVACGILVCKIIHTLGAVGFHQRMSIEGQNPNTLGILTGLGIICCLYFCESKSKDTLIQLILFLVLAFLSFICIYSQSRGAWVGLIISLGIYVLFSKVGLRKKLLKIILIASGVIVALALMVYFIPSSSYMVLERLQSFLNPAELGVLGYRLQIWEAAFEMWKGSPVLGVGLSNFPIVSSMFTFDGRAWGAHNSYVVILCELGIIGILLWVVIHFSMFRIAMINKKYMPLMLALFTLLIVVAAKGTICWAKYYWLVFGLIYASSRLDYLNGQSKPENTGKSFNHTAGLRLR